MEIREEVLKAKVRTANAVNASRKRKSGGIERRN
jgi:hypothetical protein